MDTGGASVWGGLTGDTGLPAGRAVSHVVSLRRGGNCCERPVAGVVLLLPRLESWGLADDPFLRCMVELLEVGEVA